MVVDSSVLIAVLLLEPDAEQLLNKLIDADELYLSAVSLVATAMVIECKKGNSGAEKLDEFSSLIQILVF
jgi:ribonuclease VapC